MNKTKMSILKLISLSMVIWFSPMTVQAKPSITLKAADSFPVTHYVALETIRKFMDGLKEEINFQYYPSEQIGKARDLLSLTQSGVVDIAYVAPGFVSEKMPLSTVAELPVGFTAACEATTAYWNMAKPGGVINKSEFVDNGVRPLFVLVLPPYQLMTRKPFSSLADLEGKRIRTSGAAKELMVEKLQSVPVQMPTPDVYESLHRGTIDGLLLAFNSLPPYELDKVAKHSTVGENFGSFVVTYVINDKKWNSLPVAVQEKMTLLGETITHNSCKAAEETEIRDMKSVEAEGLELVKLSPEDKEQLRVAADEVAREWAGKLDRRGLSGTDTLNAFIEQLKRQGIK